MSADVNTIAKKIIEHNQYMIIATADNDEPWISPVAYAQDENYIFYFVSMPDSKHILQILKNKRVAVAVFDSHQEWGEGLGLQIEGEVSEVTLTELPHAMTVYFTRKNPYVKIPGAFGKGLKNLLKQKRYKMYKFTPKKVWMNNPESDIDERIEIKLRID